MTEQWFLELQRAFAGQLPERLATIAALAEQGSAARAPLVEALHRLGGTAGSHGFDDVSAAAQDWERALRASQPTPADALGRLREAIARALGSIEADDVGDSGG